MVLSLPHAKRLEVLVAEDAQLMQPPTFDNATLKQLSSTMSKIW